MSGDRLKAVFVCGPWSAGTSVVTEIIERLGCIGIPPYFRTNDPRTPNSFESVPYREMLLDVVSEDEMIVKIENSLDIYSKIENFYNSITKREDIHKLIVAGKPIVLKHPLTFLLIPQISAIFDAEFVFVVRPSNEIEATRLRRGWRPRAGSAGAEKIYSSMFNAVTSGNADPILFQYNFLLRDPLQQVSKLARRLGLSASVDDIAKAALVVL